MQRSATFLILAINTFVYMLEEYLRGSSSWGQVLIALGALELTKLWEGEYWRFFTYAFLHVGSFHFIINALALYQLGILLETIVGTYTFLLVYFATTLGAGILTSLTKLYMGTSITAGASGAIFGIIGCILAMLYRRYGRNFDLMMKDYLARSIVIWGGFNLAIGAILPGIDFFAHLGGLVTGISFGFFIVEKNASRKITGMIITLALLLVFSIYVVYPWNNDSFKNYRELTKVSKIAIKKHLKDIPFDSRKHF